MHEDVRADIENLKIALAGRKIEEAFVTAISPTNLEMYFANEFYHPRKNIWPRSREAMNEEYRAIVDAGFLLQIDDPRLITHYNRTPDMSLDECRKFIALRVEAVNHCLAGHPGRSGALSHLLQRQRRVRASTTWSSSTMST